MHSWRLKGDDSATAARVGAHMEALTKADGQDAGKLPLLLRKAGLAIPAMPGKLLADPEERGPWSFSTRTLRVSPYNLGYYIQEARARNIRDYAVIAHSGHGVNSYAFQYYLVYGAVRVFLHLRWGGVYMDNDAAATSSGVRFGDGKWLTVVGSDFSESYWLRPGQSCTAEDDDSESPSEVLTAASNWLRSACRRRE